MFFSPEETLVVRQISYDFLTNCAFFDKSTKFGREVDLYGISKFGCGAIGQLPRGGHSGRFPKWPPADTCMPSEAR